MSSSNPSEEESVGEDAIDYQTQNIDEELNDEELDGGEELIEEINEEPTFEKKLSGDDQERYNLEEPDEEPNDVERSNSEEESNEEEEYNSKVDEGEESGSDEESISGEELNIGSGPSSIILSNKDDFLESDEIFQERNVVVLEGEEQATSNESIKAESNSRTNTQKQTLKEVELIDHDTNKKYISKQPTTSVSSSLEGQQTVMKHSLRTKVSPSFLTASLKLLLSQGDYSGASRSSWPPPNQVLKYMMFPFLFSGILYNTEGSVKRAYEVLKKKDAIYFLFAQNINEDTYPLLDSLNLLYKESKERYSTIEMVYVPLRQSSLNERYHSYYNKHQPSWWHCRHKPGISLNMALYFTVKKEIQVAVVNKKGFTYNNDALNNILKSGMIIPLFWGKTQKHYFNEKND